MTAPSPHFSVLVNEVVQAFSPLTIRVFVDGTVGAGGHAAAVLESHPEIECYLGIDKDLVALEIARKRLAPWEKKVVLKQGSFTQIREFLSSLSHSSAEGVLVDLGVSSMQLDESSRGFSFMREGPLDMRMNQHLGITAADIVNTWGEEELGQLFRDVGEEKQWRKAARLIVERRKITPFVTTTDLVNMLYGPLQRKAKKGIHPLTLIFQALRIAVNGELEEASSFIPEAIDLLSPKGRLAVISFHSGEDRIAKNTMRQAASDKVETSGIGGMFLSKIPTVSLITKKPIEPNEKEIEINPKSRSAKLRIIEKL